MTPVPTDTMRPSWKSEALIIVMKLSRFAGVSEAGDPDTHDFRMVGWGAGVRRRNPEQAKRVEGSQNHRHVNTAIVTQVLP